MRRKDRQVTELADICAIMKRCEVCRLGMSDDGKPYVVPMSFGYEFDGSALTLYFHCAKEGKKLDILRKNPFVCFEMDRGHALIKGVRACDYSYQYESVIGFGQAVFVEEHQEKQYAFRKIMAQYAETEDFDFLPKETGLVTIFKVTADDYTAKSNRNEAHSL